MHILLFNEYYPPGSSEGIGENTYMIGPRVPICEFHRTDERMVAGHGRLPLF